MEEVGSSNPPRSTKTNTINHRLTKMIARSTSWKRSRGVHLESKLANIWTPASGSECDGPPPLSSPGERKWFYRCAMLVNRCSCAESPGSHPSTRLLGGLHQSASAGIPATERLFRRIPSTWIDWDDWGNAAISSAAFKDEELSI